MEIGGNPNPCNHAFWANVPPNKMMTVAYYCGHTHSFVCRTCGAKYNIKRWTPKEIDQNIKCKDNRWVRRE